MRRRRRRSSAASLPCLHSRTGGPHGMASRGRRMWPCAVPWRGQPSPAAAAALPFHASSLQAAAATCATRWRRRRPAVSLPSTTPTRVGPVARRVVANARGPMRRRGAGGHCWRARLPSPFVRAPCRQSRRRARGDSVPLFPPPLRGRAPRHGVARPTRTTVDGP